MELSAIEKFVCGKIASEAPKEPGLYMYIHDEGLNEYPLVDLVEVRQYRNVLIADSDHWETYVIVNQVERTSSGIWTRRLEFVDEFEA